MPEHAVLHIQVRDSDPVRVVGLHAGSVRIGRAAYCDVRLPEPDLAEEECRLRRRGGVWHLFPSERTTGSVWLGDRPVERPCPLSIGASFRVGSHRLTLLASDSAPAWSHAYDHGPSPASSVRHDLSGQAGGPASEPAEPVASRSELAGRLRHDRQALQDGHDRWGRSLEETKKWETRFRAVGAKLRSDASNPLPQRPVARPRVDRPIVPRPDRPAIAPEYVRPAGPPDAPDLDPARVAAYRPVDPYATPRPTLLPSNTPPRHHILEGEPLEALEAERSRPPSRTAPASVVEATAVEETVVPDVAPAIEPVPAPVPVSEQFVETRLETEPGHARGLITAFDDDDDFEFDAARVAGALILGATRRVPRACPVEADAADEGSAVPIAVPEPTRAPARTSDEPAVDPPAPPDRSRLTWRWLFAKALGGRATRPDDLVAAAGESSPSEVPAVDVAPAAVADRAAARAPGSWPEESPVVPPPAAAPGGTGKVWAFQDPIVTDTYLGEAPPWSVRAPIVAATGPMRGAGFEPSGARQRVAGEGAGPGLRSEANDTATARPRGSAALGGPMASARDWPTVSDILAAQGYRGRAAERSATARSAASPRRTATAAVRPFPTVVEEPGQWSVPLWLGWLPAAGLAAVVGLGSCMASWIWARDAYNAGVVAARLATLSGKVRPLPEGVTPGRTSWWATRAAHLVQWAAYIDRTSTEPKSAAEARALLDRALEASPLDATARYTRARPLPGETTPPPLVRTLGQTRDIDALTWTGHQLLSEGKKGAALRAYAAALDMAAHADPAHAGTPTFLDDAQTRRYALPTEALIGPIVRDMAEATGWSYKDWAAIVPPGTAAPAVVARLLRERLSPDAEAALDAALAGSDQAPVGDGPQVAVFVAAQAEALALKGRWADAQERYRLAIELMPLDVVRRAWWLNLADIALRLNEPSDRRFALDLAKSDDTKDEITLRAVELQKASGLDSRRDAAVRTARASGPTP
jgi:hypothetical protein